MSVLDLVPRRVSGLPPGQGAVRTFPRFSDRPMRGAPPSGPIELAVSVDGEIQAVLGADDLQRFDRVEQVCDFHCVTTWTFRGLRWVGVRWVDVMHSVLGDDVPPFMVACAADGACARFVTGDVDCPDVLLATELDGAPLDDRHGAPLRLVSPRQYGYKSVKHLVAVDFRFDEPMSSIGAKEHLRARVDLEERHSKLPNWLVKMPYRLMIVPTALIGERSLESRASNLRS